MPHPAFEPPEDASYLCSGHLDSAPLPEGSLHITWDAYFSRQEVSTLAAAYLETLSVESHRVDGACETWRFPLDAPEHLLEVCFPMQRPLRSGLLALTLISCVGCDQAAKALVRGTLAYSPPVELLGGAVLLQYAENPGAFLSLGANLPAAARFLLGVVFVAVTLAGLLVFTFRAAGLSVGQRAGLALILSGGLGNLIDRVMNDGQVIDFVVLRLGPLHTGIFNVADVAITAGILIVLAAWRERTSPAAPTSPQE